MSDWNDRAVDAALQELHGSKPPDLSARVLMALRQGPGGPLPHLMPQRRRWWPLVALLLLSLTLGLAAAVGARWWTGSAADGDVLAIALEVHRGRVECVESGVSRAIAAGESAPPFAARPGNRLRAPVAYSVRFDAFGRLDAAAQTELEVRSMHVTRKNGVVVASSLTLAVVSGSVGWYAGSRTETARAGEVLHVQAPAGGEAIALATENQRLEKRLEELESRNEKLLAQIATRETAPPTVAPTPVESPPTAAAEPAPALAALFSDPKFADALGKIDWTQLGAVSNEMGPLLTKLAELMSKEGVEVPTELAIKIQTLNNQLLKPVGDLMGAGVPGFGPNGSYTHPLVMANAMASTLAAAGYALTSAQQQQIDGLVRAFSAEQQMIGEAPRDFRLEQLLAETEMKDRFFKEVGSLLAPDQHGALYPDGSTAYEGTSLFSTGVSARAYGDAVPAKDPDDFARSATRRLTDQLGLDDAVAEQVRAVVARSVANSELWSVPAAPIEMSGAHFLRSGRTQAALRAQLEWMRALQQQVPLTPEQRQKLAKMSRVLVPLPR
jgi:hypothetical protein